MAHGIERATVIKSDAKLVDYSKLAPISFAFWTSISISRLLEKRFSKEQIARMLVDAGFSSISFSDTAPYWCAVGLKSA